MKFVGISGKEFKILEDINLEKLAEIKDQFDFSWIDIDRLDQKSKKFFYEAYGIKDMDEGGLPRYEPSEDYDLIVLNYYGDHVRKEQQVFVSQKFIITAHPGNSPSCDKTLASLDELLISGSMSPERVLYEIILGVIECNEQSLRFYEQNVEQLASNSANLSTTLNKILLLARDVEELLDVLTRTQELIRDLASPSLVSENVNKPEYFRLLYFQSQKQTSRIEELKSTTDTFVNSTIPSIWSSVSNSNRALVGVAYTALGLAAASLFLYFFPDDILDIKSIYVAGAIIIAAILTSIIVQRGSHTA
jgi:Mg2+ and Co2+ transporter CorA